MIDFFKKMITEKEIVDLAAEPINEKRRLQIATCALFLEVAHSDDDFSIEEKIFIESTMRDKFNLDEQTVSELIELSMKQTDKSVSLYEFTEIINQHFDKNAKYEVIKKRGPCRETKLDFDKYEEHFLRKISGNLHIEHSDFIAAKLEVKAENNL